LGASYNQRELLNRRAAEEDDIIRPNGIVSIRKACTNIGQYQFDDGTTMTNLNQCVSRISPVGQYYVLLCTSSDDCNSNCVTTTPTTPLPESVLCYSCVSYDGSDCQSSVCRGKFCVYERRISGNQMMMRKGCTGKPMVVLDDATIVEEVGVCEIRRTLTSQYFVKICDSEDYCNNYCNLVMTTTPKRQPSVTCYECESYGFDCFTGRCAGQYCLYEHQIRQPAGTTFVKKSCTNLPFFDYPDGTVPIYFSTIQEVQYEVLVCNLGNNCNAACHRQKGTCYNCEATNQDDCTTGTCQGSYCTFRDPAISGLQENCSTSILRHSG
uniref:C3H1-type domain-containing protein n=1 Tax=Angiostrongylus cantonensis TaxID=6313 RepID=A0A0K0DD59_ANGCA